MPIAARTEVIPLATSTPTDAGFLRGESGPAATIAGLLSLPRADAGPLPTVILLHGSGGPVAYVGAWAARLQALGWASFLVDSFSGRGLASVRGQQGALGRLVGALDAYRACERLRTHPLVDRRRIVLMGFSRGGQGALYAALRRFQRLHLRAEAAFAAHIAFYPNCCTRYLEDEDVAAAPIRIHHGEADDFNPIDASQAYVDRLRARGHDAEITRYPGAHHVFDWEGFATPVVAPGAQSMRRCRIVESRPGELVDAGTGRPFSYESPCIERGTTAAHDPGAARAALRAVEQFLARVAA